MKVFRAYADEWRGKRHYYVQVRVHPTRKAMIREIDAMASRASSDVEGQCTGVSHYNVKGRLTGRMALMWLNEADLRRNGAELVAHECVHAAMRHVMNKRIDLSEIAGEEVLCYTAGSLTRQINNRLHALGVYHAGAD